MWVTPEEILLATTLTWCALTLHHHHLSLSLPLSLSTIISVCVSRTTCKRHGCFALQQRRGHGPNASGFLARLVGTYDAILDSRRTPPYRSITTQRPCAV